MEGGDDGAGRARKDYPAARLKLGDVFLLRGRTGPRFKVLKLYKAAGFIPSVFGITEDGTATTAARLRDVVKVSAPKRARSKRAKKDNPPRAELFSRRVLRLEYLHALNGDGRGTARRHDFGPGVQMFALSDGSVLLKHRDPRKRVWADLPDRGR